MQCVAVAEVVEHPFEAYRKRPLALGATARPADFMRLSGVGAIIFGVWLTSR
ncbi:hypothetical protein [Paraburkholderia sp. BL21I4N1]|uniref:hypothetical protein n=1 Tax=Paraburkholderia sp. BL21I4N1 TaxID=1938801 RepID=UPI000D42533F|nr:hypothetical protein [Paraburkholderia sp. BL21I4N1]PQV49792.1 hypothetical protein B0G83_10681 [Paraburkholderia sp. BL21I4N1]